MYINTCVHYNMNVYALLITGERKKTSPAFKITSNNLYQAIQVNPEE